MVRTTCLAAILLASPALAQEERVEDPTMGVIYDPLLMDSQCILFDGDSVLTWDEMQDLSFDEMKELYDDNEQNTGEAVRVD